MATLRTFLIQVHTPKGIGEIEVPTTLGPEAAERRALVSAASVGWGDLDELEAVAVGTIPNR